MKKTAKSLAILLFFMFIFYFCGIFCEFNQIKKNAKASGFHNKTTEEFIFRYSGKVYKFYKDERQNDTYIKKEFLEKEDNKQIVSTLKEMGFSNKEIVFYLMPELKSVIEKLKNTVNKNYTEDQVFIKKNDCAIDIKKGKNGSFLDEENLFKNILKKFENTEKIDCQLMVKSFTYGEDKTKTLTKKSYFETSFKTSSTERKQNIKKALSVFDGIVLSEGEVLSFNLATGPRTFENGYSKAKIISNGTFTEGFGGGVCQVSTTLYNACLLAGLEILEVHPHSLPVSYIEPSFDAMVSVGSSDLVIRNNTGGKIIITTSSKNDVCAVKIFGLKNKYKIKRKSEKIKTIPKEVEIVDVDYEKYGLYNLAVGEEKRLSYAKDGYYSKGFLDYYDSSGNLVLTKEIRQNKYNPTKGVIVKREK